MSFPSIEIPEPVLEIARKLEDAGFEAWCVGGNLRDALLQHPHSDYDIATSATPEQVQKLFPRTVEVGIKYGTVGVLDRARQLHEVTTFRRDVATDGRHAVVAYGVTLEEDLARRDFTINALAYHPLRHEWRDPFDGAGDLANHLVRAVGDPAQRFREDYLRILRAVRFSSRFDFTIDPLTWEAAKAAAPGLTGLSAERVRDEWFKGLRTARSVTQLLMLWVHVGAARVWIPELEVARPSQKAYPDPPLGDRDPVLLTALVCPSPVAVLRRLKASNAELGRATGLERGPEEPRGLDQVLVRRWLADVGPAAGDLSALWALRHGGEAPWSAAMAEIRERRDPLTRADLAIGGADLQELGIHGPRIGETLATLLDRVLDDPTLNTRESLLAIAPGGPVSPLGFAAAAALGNVVGALAVVRHLRRGLRLIDTCLAFGAGFMLAVTVLGVLPEVLKGSPNEALYVLLGYFAVHLAQHVFTPHFHFGEETHRLSAAAGNSALLGLTLHTFFDGVAIASGFLVSGQLGILLFLAVLLHKLPEGVTIASVMVAGGQSRGRAIGAAAILGGATVLGVLLTEQIGPLARHGLALSGGVTLYVAASNLVPEFQAKRGWPSGLAFVGGAVGFFLTELLLEGWLR